LPGIPPSIVFAPKPKAKAGAHLRPIDIVISIVVFVTAIVARTVVPMGIYDRRLIDARVSGGHTIAIQGVSPDVHRATLLVYHYSLGIY
jgi:hypothetical protein